MPYWNFEYTKAVIYTVVKVGGGIGQDPATEVTHLRLNQPPVFSSVYILLLYCYCTCKTRLSYKKQKSGFARLLLWNCLRGQKCDGRN